MKLTGNTIRTLILVILMMTASAYAQKDDAGTTGASFLKLGVGARAAGMGFSAFTLSQDATSLYWNPAALADVLSTDVTMNYNNLYAGMKHGFLGLALPGSGGTFGIGLVYFNSGTMTRTEAIPSGGLPYTQLGTFSNHDGALMLQYGLSVADNVHVGLSVKGIYESTGGESAYGGAADIGVFAKLQMVDIGFAVKNIGTKIKYQDASASLPLQVLLGAAVHVDDNFLVTASGGSVGEGTTRFSVGAEYRYEFVAFRAGYRTGFADLTGSLKGLTAGLGLYYKNIRLDYAYNAFGDLGGVHLISLGFDLGGDSQREAPAEETSPAPITPANEVTPTAAPEVTDTTAAAPVQVEERTGTVVPASVSVYLQASTKSKVVVKVKKNDRVKILDENATWFFVETAAGKQGWIQKKNVKEAR